MDAIYYNQGRIRPRVAVIKSLASAISIGSGASVGREGPIVQIGSAFGSTLGTLMSLRVSERVTLIAAGAGAGIAATFNAPLGGIVFAIELLLITINARNLLLVTTATVVATRIGHFLLGTDPSFYVPTLERPDFQLIHPWGLAVFVVLGVLMGLLSVAFIRGLYGMEDLFEAMPGNYYSRHALGMLCVGVMMYLLMRNAGHYYVEGVGYATIMEILRGSLSSPWFLLLLAALKLLATCLSLGSGASGGVFSPALFMGAAGGAAFGHLCRAIFPDLEITVPAFAIAGMAAGISGSTGAVLTGVIMLSEMTKDHSIMLPLVITCSVAYAVRKGVMSENIYTMKLRARGHSVPEGLHSALLTSLRLRDLLARDFAFVRPGDEIPSDALFVVRGDDTLVSEVTRGPAAQRALAGGETTAGPLRFVIASEDESLLSAVTTMWAANAAVILVARKPESNRADDLAGVVTREALLGVLGSQEEIS